MDGSDLIYPEKKAAGFTHRDGTIEFYTRVNALLRPDMHVLDYGAGRGATLLSEEVPYRSRLATLHGKVARLVAVDVDDAVLEHQHSDEQHVVGIGERLPFDDQSFDLIIADWVIEHVADPEHFEAEVRRLLKPGGWFCARTPNKLGLTGLGARAIPNRWHVRLLKVLQPQRKAVDVFPVTYKLNSRRAIRQRFAPEHWINATYVSNSEPPYVLRWPAIMVVVFGFWRLAPRALYTNLLVFVQRR